LVDNEWGFGNIYPFVHVHCQFRADDAHDLIAPQPPVSVYYSSFASVLLLG